MSQKMASTLKPLRYYDTKMKNEKAKKQTTKKEKLNKKANKQIDAEKTNKQTNARYLCLPLHGHLKQWELIIALFLS